MAEAGGDLTFTVKSGAEFGSVAGQGLDEHLLTTPFRPFEPNAVTFVQNLQAPCPFVGWKQRHPIILRDDL
jgi:hypothetical protein